MTNKVLFIIIVAFLFVRPTIGAQSNTCQLSMDELHNMIGRKVDMFLKYVSIIGNKDKSTRVRFRYIDNAANLFINSGKRSTMEVTSKYKGSRFYTINEYLNHILNVRYDEIELTGADSYTLSEFVNEGNRYSCTATIKQRFCGYKYVEGKRVKKYCDTTVKTFKVYIYEVVDSRGYRCIIRLGDVTAGMTY